jgi:hypothetical protein
MPTVPAVNRQVRLAARPNGLPARSDWHFTQEPVAEPGPGEFLVRVEYVSVDPAMRGWVSERRSYWPPVAIGAVMRAGGVGEVIRSNHPDHPVGQYVEGPFGVQQYAIADGRDVRAIDPAVAPPPVHLGALGMIGMTAYFGLLDVGRPQPGQTVLVSAAAGAVGSAAGQIAKIVGCRAVGIAGGPEKCRAVVDEFGFDAAIDYKAEDVRAAIREHCPDGVDVYFDNVGGSTLEASLANLARGARVVLCGAISQYNATERPKGPANYMSLLVNRARMEGFLVFDYRDRYEEAARELAAWRAEGRLRSREEVVEGIDAFPEALVRLFTGRNDGKVVLRVADVDPAIGADRENPGDPASR